jgi:hypothetical protein
LEPSHGAPAAHHPRKEGIPYAREIATIANYHDEAGHGQIWSDGEHGGYYFVANDALVGVNRFNTIEQADAALRIWLADRARQRRKEGWIMLFIALIVGAALYGIWTMPKMPKDYDGCDMGQWDAAPHHPGPPC